LDVSVLDRDGNPVTGLTPDDFVVTLNKETQPVRTMVFLATQSHSTTETVRVPSPGSPPSPTPAAAPDASREPDPKLLVILIDDMSIYPTDSKGLFVAAERFVDTIPARDWVGLASTSGRMTVNPSRDRAQLMTNLKGAFGWMNDPRRDSKPFVGFMDALEADEIGASLLNLIETACRLPVATKNLAQLLAENQCASDIDKKVRDNARFARTSTRNQLDTYANVIKAMASAPGVKQLVILTGGIALKPADSLDFVPVAKAAAAAGVQITMLMEEPQEDITVGGAWVIDQRRMLQQAETLAEMSGGQLFHVVGQADRFYQRVLTSASAIYRIGVDLPQTVPSDGDYKVAVTVKRRGVRVLASRYAAPPPPKIELTQEERLQHAVTTGESLFALPMQMAAEIVPAAGEASTAIRVSIDVPGEMPGPVSGILGIVGPAHVLKSSHHDLARSTDGKTYHLDLLVPATAGTYELRFAAADGSRAVGAISRTIVMQETQSIDPAGTGRDGRSDIADVAAPEPRAAGLLAKAAAYLDSYEKAFAVVVSEETYSQELHVDPPLGTRPTNVNPASLTERTRTLRSDVLQASVGEREWVAFRDVYEVDGKAVRDHDVRLQKLFLDTPAQALEQARRIVAESARFNLGALRRDFNVPTMALTYLSRSNQRRSVFTIAGRKDVGGVPAVALEFKERATPTIIRSADADLPATGRFWIDPESGRVLKSELAVADKRSTGKITVTYGPVAKLTVWAPVLMTEEYTGAEAIFAKARYSKFRQFNVSVGEAIK
jgi:VWFA-related protein